MEKIMEFLENVIMPPLMKVSEQRHVRAVRDGVVVTLPLTIMGSIFILIQNFPTLLPWSFFDPLNNYIINNSYLFAVPSTLTISLMALFTAFGIGYALGKDYGYPPLNTAILATIGFLFTNVPLQGDVVVTGTADILSTGWFLPVSTLGATGLFGAIIASLASVEIYHLLKKYNIVISMPEGVPESVSNSFAALFPAFFIVMIFWIITFVFGIEINNILNDVLSPLQTLLTGDSLFAILAIIFLVTLFWGIGVHGLAIMGNFLYPFWMIAITQNQEFLAANPGDFANVPNIAPEPFYQWFVWIGGAGATISLLIVCLLFAKSAYLKEVSKIALIPSIFNINEPTIFGMPIVMNPILIIPFMITPMVNAIITYFVISVNIMPAPTVYAPWVAPVGVGGLLATQSIVAVLLVAINIVIGCVIYYPFMKMYDKKLMEA